jgi:long-chain-fatty-acid--CoA ligase ACSBG
MKAFVVYGEKTLAPEFKGDKRFFLWNDFIEFGKTSEISDDIIFAKMWKQTPGMCCDLGYTSGTTGNPKAVMHSHDNQTWLAQLVTDILVEDYPDFDVSGGRVVSYLPLSHAAGMSADIMAPMTRGSKIYFA